MKTVSLKALANKVLQRNSQRNLVETKGFHRGKLEGEKVSNENTAYCYWLKSVIDNCQMPCFEIDAKIVNRECPHFKTYWAKRLSELQNTGG